MLETIPSESAIKKLLGKNAYSAWQCLTDFIQQNYTMDRHWDEGKKVGVYECKFRKSGKTFCSFYLREQSFGFMVIYGKKEREQFESEIHDFSAEIRVIYQETKTYHDGKWIMINVENNRLLTDLKNLLIIKKKPNKKAV